MKLFERHVLTHASGIVAVSDREVSDIRNVGYTGNIRVIPNPVVVQKNKFPVLEHSDVITIVYLGRYDIEHKGLNFLLDTFKILSSDRNDLRLSLYGDGPDRDLLVEKIKNEKIYFAKIFDPVFDAEKEFVLKSATIFFQPSRWEVFGISLVEAMMLGKPVVLTEGCYLSTLLQSNNLGLVVPFEARLAAGMLRDYLKSGRLKEDGARNKKFAEAEFSLNKIALQTLKFYLSLANSPQYEISTPLVN
jgi:glycosyltransferase involved in cell wall biosynthesis